MDMIWIGLIILGWVLVGSGILNLIDHSGELAIWKMQAPALLIFFVNLLWPIVMLLYLTKKDNLK